ncbi:MAG: hypothetical protein KDA24_21980, partial [Deltaproteobacteria bacterium]|nr:hypothetical protein [Deltaproteobacteria bacterium]
VPDDPSDHWTHGVGDVFGCNRLVCGTCGASVRSVAHRGPAKTLGAEQLTELADTVDWSGSPLLKKAYFQRLYACRCTSFVESERRLVQDDDRDAFDVVLPWSCGGHPMPALPVDSEGLTLSSDTDWGSVVRQVFDGEGPGGDHVSWNELPTSWLARLYHRMRGLPESVALSRAIATGLESERPEDVGSALLFFRWWPHAVGSEKVLPLADRVGGATVFPAPLRDISTPESPAITLGAQARASETVAPELVEHLRGAATSTDDGVVGSGRFAPLLQALAMHDADWLARSAADVAAGDDTRADELLRALRDQGDDARVLAAGTALASAGLTEAVKAFALSAFSQDRTYAPLLLRAVAQD